MSANEPLIHRNAVNRFWTPVRNLVPETTFRDGKTGVWSSVSTIWTEEESQEFPGLKITAKDLATLPRTAILATGENPDLLKLEFSRDAERNPGSIFTHVITIEFASSVADALRTLGIKRGDLVFCGGPGVLIAPNELCEQRGDHLYKMRVGGPCELEVIKATSGDAGGNFKYEEASKVLRFDSNGATEDVLKFHNRLNQAKRTKGIEAGYTALSNLPSTGRVNVYGIVVNFTLPRRTRNDHLMVLHIADETTKDVNQCVQVSIFSSDLQGFPDVRCLGDVVRFHRAECGEYGGHHNLQVNPSKGASMCSTSYATGDDEERELRTSAGAYLRSAESASTLQQQSIEASEANDDMDSELQEQRAKRPKTGPTVTRTRMNWARVESLRLFARNKIFSIREWVVNPQYLLPLSSVLEDRYGDAVVRIVRTEREGGESFMEMEVTDALSSSSSVLETHSLLVEDSVLKSNMRRMFSSLPTRAGAVLKLRNVRFQPGPPSLRIFVQLKSSVMLLPSECVVVRADGYGQALSLSGPPRLSGSTTADPRRDLVHQVATVLKPPLQGRKRVSLETALVGYANVPDDELPWIARARLVSLISVSQRMTIDSTWIPEELSLTEFLRHKGEWCFVIQIEDDTARANVFVQGDDAQEFLGISTAMSTRFTQEEELRVKKAFESASKDSWLDLAIVPMGESCLSLVGTRLIGAGNG